MGEWLRSGRGRGWKEFVAIDASGDASAVVVRLYADDFREAADMHIAGEGNLPRQGENKFNRTSGFKIGVDQKIKSAEADVPRLALPFNPAVRPACPDFQRKRHRKSPRGPAFS
jgi:predicted membrane-bound spermidine synthase